MIPNLYEGIRASNWYISHMAWDSNSRTACSMKLSGKQNSIFKTFYLFFLENTIFLGEKATGLNLDKQILQLIKLLLNIMFLDLFVPIIFKEWKPRCKSQCKHQSSMELFRRNFWSLLNVQQLKKIYFSLPVRSPLKLSQARLQVYE